MAGGGERRERKKRKKHTRSRVQEIKQTQTAEKSSEMCTWHSSHRRNGSQKIQAAWGHMSCTQAAGEEAKVTRPSVALDTRLIPHTHFGVYLFSYRWKKKNENFIVPANQRGGSPPAWDPLNSSSFFPAALESTDLILIIYGRHFLLPYLCCVHVPHRFRTSPALYKGLSIGSPPTDLSTLPRPVLSSVLQPALVTSQSRWVRQQRVLERKEKKKGVFFVQILWQFIKSPGDTKVSLESTVKGGFISVHSCGWWPWRSSTAAAILNVKCTLC